MVEENLAIAQRALTEITSIKGDNITLLFEWHNSKILQGIHVRINFNGIYQIVRHGDWAGKKDI